MTCLTDGSCSYGRHASPSEGLRQRISGDRTARGGEHMMEAAEGSA
jgi:hypothetical protein